MTNQDTTFYSTVGPFLSRREIVKELGFPVWDEEGKVWFVAIEKGCVLGFAATREEAGGIIFCSAYVLPKHRRQGIYNALFDARLKEHSGVRITSIINPVLRSIYLSRKFTKTGHRGHYLQMKREPK